MISDRKFTNKMLYFLYKLMRSFYVSLFFYFMPFSVVIASSVIPTLFSTAS